MKNWGGKNEALKHQASQGFDNSGNLMKTLIKIAIIAAAVIAIVAVIYTITNPGEGVGGGQRNCILSVMGNAPDCSDNDGALKTTYANGKYMGECYGLDTSGTCIE